MNLAPRRGEEFEYRKGVSCLKQKRHSPSVSTIGFTSSL